METKILQRKGKVLTAKKKILTAKKKQIFSRQKKISEQKKNFHGKKNKIIKAGYKQNKNHEMIVNKAIEQIVGRFI